MYRLTFRKLPKQTLFNERLEILIKWDQYYTQNKNKNTNVNEVSFLVGKVRKCVCACVFHYLETNYELTWLLSH